MSLAELNEYDHQFLDYWVAIEEEILQEQKMQSDFLNPFTHSTVSINVYILLSWF